MATMRERGYDVAIIGGGPGGSTLGGMLLKHNPKLRVCILEKERFPREHVGESQLPPISGVLAELGCWEKVEAAGFPIKIGATYTWGDTKDPWDFEFLPLETIPEEATRPGRYEGWRVQTAFQVERARYDEILLDHAKELGCEVREGTRVATVRRDGDRVTGLELEGGEVVTATHYVDASGNAAVLRRAMDVGVDAPTLLRNVAFWGYWENAPWIDRISTGATRVHIRSLGYGWLWYIALSETRASIGLVTPATHYKKAGKKPETMYMEAVRAEPSIAKLISGAERDGEVLTTTDWSYVVDRLVGENWFLVGECSGFADPILAAGLTLTQTGARELAYTILEMERGELDRSWLTSTYNETQRRRVLQHMRFAEYWYSANGFFDNIREHCTEIAKDAGLRLDPAGAFQWLAQGGLGDDAPGQVGVGGLDVAGIKQIMARFSGATEPTAWSISGKNVFKLNLANAKKAWAARYIEGRVERVTSYVRGDKQLKCLGVQGMLLDALQESSDVERIIGSLRAQFALQMPQEHIGVAMQHAMQTLEVMVNEFWVLASVKKGRPTLDLRTPLEGKNIRTRREALVPR